MSILNYLLHPTYFHNIAHYALMVKSNGKFALEVQDNYQKQTFRNRCDILAANGKLSLTIPVIYSQKKRQLTKDVRIFNEVNWQSQHLKSLQSAYRMSPFYEFYEDDLLPLFERKYDFLLDFTMTCFDLINSLLEIDFDFKKTENYQVNSEEIIDFRHLVQPKKSDFKNQRYAQVYEQKFGFIENLSILDLLFNEGPVSMNYLTAEARRT